MQVGAEIAEMFKVDPVDVLNADSFTWAVRIAAAEHVNEEKRKEAARKASMPKPRIPSHR